MGKPDQPSAKSSNHIKTSKQKFYQQIPPQSLLIHVLKIKVIRSLTTKKNPSAVKFRTVFLGRGGRGNIRRGRSDTGVLRDRLVLILACHWLHYHSTGMLFSQIVDQKKKKTLSISSLGYIKVESTHFSQKQRAFKGLSHANMPENQQCWHMHINFRLQRVTKCTELPRISCARILQKVWAEACNVLWYLAPNKTASLHSAKITQYVALWSSHNVTWNYTLETNLNLSR